MELKNAITLCLVMLFSATLVLLIARALDVQTAERLEPQLAQIVEELRAIRGAGPISTSGGGADAATLDNGLVVYYFHGTKRCPTCEAIESQSHEVVQNDFAAELKSGAMAWKILNFEKPAAAELTKRFEIMQPVLVLARTNGGQIEDWKRLDRVWALVGDKPEFAEYIRGEIRTMLDAKKPNAAPTPGPPATEAPSIPLPSVDVEPEAMPLPK
jgi:hypothetical protein